MAPAAPVSRASVRRLRRTLRRLVAIPRDVRRVGVPAATAIYASWLLERRQWGTPRIGCLRVKGFDHPIYFRHGTSDAQVVRQIFMKEEYACVSREADVRFIVDCGANIGLSAFYLLSRYPRATLVAIEPDPGNVAMVRRNLAAFGSRAHVLQAGVWSRECGLKIERGLFGDGAEWSFQVRPCRGGETPDVEAVGIAGVMERHRLDRIDLLKIDIERSEIEVFGHGCDDWLSRTRNLAIELHGEDCDKALSQALSRYRYTRDRADELTICRDIRGLGE
jgi:FkbM family methyltransferase